MPPPRVPGFLVLLLLAGCASLLLLLVSAGPAAGSAAGAGAIGAPAWRWPVRGEVVLRFSYSRARPFARGARRGLDVAAAPGAPVGAACGGRITFAGRVPSGGRGVSVRCGALVATHLGLGGAAVRRGAFVVPGARLGWVGAGGRLRLGARRARDRFGYVDPERLLGDAPPDVPGVPLGRAPRTPAAVPSPVAPPHVAAPAVSPALAPPAPAGVPFAAWAGLVVLAAGLPLGGLVHRGRRRRARHRPELTAVGTAERL